MKRVKIGRDRTNFVHALNFAGKWFLCYNIFCRVPLERRWISPFTWTTQSKSCAVNSHKMAQLFWGYLKGDVISITSRKVFKKYSLSMVYILGHLRTNAIALTFYTTAYYNQLALYVIGQSTSFFLYWVLTLRLQSCVQFDVHLLYFVTCQVCFRWIFKRFISNEKTAG